MQGGIAIIDDGTFGYNGTTNTLLVARSSELTINGGTFTNPNSGRGAIVTDKQFVGTVTINEMCIRDRDGIRMIWHL